MTKQEISSKVVRARILAIYELDKFIELIGIADPELNLEQATVIAALIVRHLWKNIQGDPELQNLLKKVATDIKSSRKKNQKATNEFSH
ncbi:hypothetical protein [Nostoc sp.]|uniref:hypothetical protein n=1 Tax=Nostoc sp. TaxID=1180 RepID=UPI002FFA3462